MDLHAKGHSVSKIALQTGRSETTARQCLVRRKITPNKPQTPRTPWSAEEDAKLLKLEAAGIQSLQVAKALGRTEGSTRGRIRRLRLGDKSRSVSQEELKSAIEWHQEGVSYSDIAERLGKRLHTVVVAMIDQTGKPIGQPQTMRPRMWNHHAKRADSDQHSTALSSEQKQVGRVTSDNRSTVD